MIQQPLQEGDRRQLHELPTAQFDTQRRRVLLAASEDQEPVEGISVLVAAEDPQTSSEAITERDADQVLDGVVEYGSHRVVVIESKLDGLIATLQHQQI